VHLYLDSTIFNSWKTNLISSLGTGKEFYISDAPVKKAKTWTTPKGLSRLKYPVPGILMMLCIGTVYSWSVFSGIMVSSGFGLIK